MPRGYYQCPKCRILFTTHYKTMEGVPEIWCACGTKQPSDKGTLMTYRGDGWEGRGNIPHGTKREEMRNG